MNNKDVKIALLEIALVITFVIMDAYGYAFISQTIPILILTVLSLKFRKEKWSSIGFKRTSDFSKYLVIGLVAGIVLEVFAMYVSTPVISSIFDVEPDYSSFQGIQGDVGTLLFFIIFSWVLAAFGEEICFRGFLMNRVSQVFHGSPNSWIISLILTSILFGFGHSEQGVSGWVQEGLSGLYLGILYLATGRNLVAPIVSHGVSNTLAFIMMYYGIYPGIGY